MEDKILQQLAEAQAELEKQKRIAREKEIERPEGFEVEDGIKSRERVQDLAEVFTAKREVDAMLDALGSVAYDIEARFLEPACGNGNFLEEILHRKLTAVTGHAGTQEELEFMILKALTSTYGIDISQDNVDEARARLKVLADNCFQAAGPDWQPNPGFSEAVDYVLQTNVVVGDFLSGLPDIVVVEYTCPAPFKFSKRYFTMESLRHFPGGLDLLPSPFKVSGARHYLEIQHDD